MRPSEWAEKMASTGNWGELTSFMEAKRGGEIESWSWPRRRGRCRVGEVMG